MSEPGHQQDALKQLADMFEAFGRALLPVGEAINRAMTEFIESPAGQYLLVVVKYYEDHPAEYQALLAARTAEANHQYCNCLCQRWGHLGICRTDAATDATMWLYDEPLQVPMCGPCANDVAARRLALR